ncbi:MAG: MBL fold metallo-hydrolase [Candidatus Korobacteraceae bacterium]
MIVKIVGTAAGGGFPQWNCGCDNCAGVRAGRIQATPRSQLQVAVSVDGEDWLLLNASPDLRTQIEATPELRPRRLRGSPIRGVVLTSGDLDQVLGLLLLREFTPLQICSTASVRRILREDNAFFGMLAQVPEQSRWIDVRPQQIFEPLPGLCCRPVAMSGGFPRWVAAGRAHALVPSEAVLGLILETGREGKRTRVAYMPAIPEYSERLLAELANCDAILADGTFWSDDELQRLQPGVRSAREMGHLPLGGRDGALAQTQTLTRPRKVFVHINNTNPILNEQSPQFAEARAAGWEAGKDGWQLTF